MYRSARFVLVFFGQPASEQVQKKMAKIFDQEKFKFRMKGNIIPGVILFIFERQHLYVLAKCGKISITRNSKIDH